MSEVMIDIETLGTNPNSCILTIGAIKFDRHKDIIELKDCETFYCRIDKDSCLSIGMNIDNDTLEWWKKQNKQARYEALENTDRIKINDALLQLKNFIKNAKYIWANSPNFDCIILENAFKICDIEVPWKFWILRDCRTVYDIGKTNLNSFIKETVHNSLIDCHNQILCLQKAFKKIKI